MPPRREQPPRPVQLIRARLAEIMNMDDPSIPGSRIGDARAGVYAFYDFDGEPIYVGHTVESFRVRVARHLTGQRSDAVAKAILDPFEVCDVELWSLSPLAPAPADVVRSYEYTVYKQLEERSRFGAVLNEGAIPATDLVELPPSVRERMIPDELWEDRQHSDVRIARRASTIARLAQTISEREVSDGMRRTLLLQAQRLAWLAGQRVEELGVTAPPATTSAPDSLFDDLADDGDG